MAFIGCRFLVLFLILMASFASLCHCTSNIPDRKEASKSNTTSEKIVIDFCFKFDYASRCRGTSKKWWKKRRQYNMKKNKPTRARVGDRETRTVPKHVEKKIIGSGNSGKREGDTFPGEQWRLRSMDQGKYQVKH
ncbi:unnamed protein product [Lactuca saligna]|uniref:Uncharacterized protein n=1 Tax=Lactuca saligna TaxID=75948 RepID=A0AA35VIV4_LACSI|nr:unnamed protein product [Lactuca saligna]